MPRRGKAPTAPPGGIRVLTPEEQEAAAQQQLEQQMPVQVAPGVIMMPQGMTPNMPIMTPNGMLVPVQPAPEPMQEEPPPQAEPIMIAPSTPPVAPPDGTAPAAAPIAPLAEPNYIPADQQGR